MLSSARSALPHCGPMRATPPPLTTDHRVSVSPECITAFNDLKLGKSTKWIIYKISDDWKEIVVEDSSTEANYSVFREKLLNAKSKDRRGNEGIGGRYAVYDVEYDTAGEGKRYDTVVMLSPCYRMLTPTTEARSPSSPGFPMTHRNT